jgi:hypothetical protein
MSYNHTYQKGQVRMVRYIIVVILPNQLYL